MQINLSGPQVKYWQRVSIGISEVAELDEKKKTSTMR